MHGIPETFSCSCLGQLYLRPGSWEARGAAPPSHPHTVILRAWTPVSLWEYQVCTHPLQSCSDLPLSRFFLTCPILWTSPHMSVHIRCCFQVIQVRNGPQENCNVSTFHFRIICLNVDVFHLSVTIEWCPPTFSWQLSISMDLINPALKSFSDYFYSIQIRVRLISSKILDFSRKSSILFDCTERAFFPQKSDDGHFVLVNKVGDIFLGKQHETFLSEYCLRSVCQCRRRHVLITVLHSVNAWLMKDE